jgi:hypothetical protein
MIEDSWEPSDIRHRIGFDTMAGRVRYVFGLLMRCISSSTGSASTFMNNDIGNDITALQNIFEPSFASDRIFILL